MKRSFYEILGVPHDANQATLDTAYAQATQRVTRDIKFGAADATMEARLVRELKDYYKDGAAVAAAMKQEPVITFDMAKFADIKAELIKRANG